MRIKLSPEETARLQALAKKPRGELLRSFAVATDDYKAFAADGFVIVGVLYSRDDSAPTSIKRINGLKKSYANKGKRAPSVQANERKYMLIEGDIRTGEGYMYILRGQRCD